MTVQFDGTRTMLYFGLDDDNSTFVRPSPSNLDLAISAFSLVRSGIVICAAGAVIEVVGATCSGALAVAEAVADAGWVTVTVAGAAGFSLLQDAIVVAATTVATNEVAFFMKAG